MKKILYFLFATILIITISGCSEKKEDNTNKDKDTTTEEKNKTYSSHGASIVLPNNFYEKNLASATAYFESTKAILMFLKEDLSSLATINIGKNSTLGDYANAVLANNEMTAEVKDHANFKYFTYEKSNNGKDFFYVSTLFKANDAFWLVTFACEKKDQNFYQTEFLKWAETIKFE